MEKNDFSELDFLYQSLSWTYSLLDDLYEQSEIADLVWELHNPETFIHGINSEKNDDVQLNVVAIKILSQAEERVEKMLRRVERVMRWIYGGEEE